MALSTDPAVLANVFKEAYGAEPWPTPLRQLKGDVGALSNFLSDAIAKGVDNEELMKLRMTLGSLVLGRAAERAFEARYRAGLSGAEVSLQDLREGRTDTDYTLVNGQGRQWYRINIKLHGSLFRRAKELVGIEPEDCFPLATYKIYSAVQKQEQEHRPYVFLIVTDVGLSALEAGSRLPASLLAAVYFGKRIIKSGKRALEERIVDLFEQRERHRAHELQNRLASAKWYLISARKADLLLRDKLYDRVFALKQRAFTTAFRNAEIDMHLSFSRDMLSLDEFLQKVEQDGHFSAAGMLERGTI